MDIFTNNMFFGIFISLIAFEIGKDQAQSIKDIALKYFENIKIDVKKDLSGKNRMLFVYNY